MATISRSQIKKHAKADIMAGLTVAILVIPQAMGYALIAGLPPILGLYTAFIPLLIYPLFGTSPYIIVGCAAIPSMMLYSSITPFAEPFSADYVELATLMTFLVGACLILLRLIKFGRLAKLISRPVIYGYTAGAAILILISQIKYMLQANVSSSANNLEYFSTVFRDISSIHWLSVLVGVVSLIIILIARRISKKIPIALIVLLIGIAIVYFLRLDNQGLEVIKEIPAGLPKIMFPNFEWALILKLLPYSILIALVSYVQSYAIAKTFAMQEGEDNLEGDQELFALGAMNLISSFFQCFPSTGSLTKSAVNYEAGSKSGFSSIISGAMIAIVLLFFTGMFYYLPKAILAAIIIVAVLKFINIKGMRSVFGNSKLDFAILLTTLLITLFYSIQMGVFAGILLSIILGVYRTGSMQNFINIFRQKAVLAQTEGDTLKLQTPIIYTNSDYAYANLKSKIQQSNAKFIDTNEMMIDYEGKQILNRLSKELDVKKKA